MFTHLGNAVWLNLVNQVYEGRMTEETLNRYQRRHPGGSITYKFPRVNRRYQKHQYKVIQ